MANQKNELVKWKSRCACAFASSCFVYNAWIHTKISWKLQTKILCTRPSILRLSLLCQLVNGSILMGHSLVNVDRERTIKAAEQRETECALNGIRAWDIEPFRLPLSMWMLHEFVLKLLFAEESRERSFEENGRTREIKSCTHRFSAGNDTYTRI